MLYQFLDVNFHQSIQMISGCEGLGYRMNMKWFLHVIMSFSFRLSCCDAIEAVEAVPTLKRASFPWLDFGEIRNLIHGHVGFVLFKRRTAPSIFMDKDKKWWVSLRKLNKLIGGLISFNAWVDLWRQFLAFHHEHEPMMRWKAAQRRIVRSEEFSCCLLFLCFKSKGFCFINLSLQAAACWRVKNIVLLLNGFPR